MYIMRIELGDYIKAMNCPQLMHGAIESSFETYPLRKLWRIDKINGRYYLLVVCSERSDLSKVKKDFCRPDAECGSKSYDDYLNSIENGSKWRFRLAAFPSYKKTRNGDNKVHAHCTEGYQKAWLKSQAAKHGFYTRDDWFEVSSVRDINFRKKKENNVWFKECVFNGILTVTDADAFRKALVNGIGHRKAYGMGMLSVCKY